MDFHAFVQRITTENIVQKSIQVALSISVKMAELVEKHRKGRCAIVNPDGPGNSVKEQSTWDKIRFNACIV